MKTQTILDAAMMAHQSLSMNMLPKKAYRRGRQSFVFRARILRMNAENIEQLAQAEIQEKNLNKRIAEYREEIIEKDEEIRVLEAGIDIRDKALVQVDLEMWRE